MKLYNFFEKRTGATLPCTKCRTNMTQSETVTSKFVFYINFPKFWYIMLLVTTFFYHIPKYECYLMDYKAEHYFILFLIIKTYKFLICQIYQQNYNRLKNHTLNRIKMRVFFGKDIQKKHLCHHNKNYCYFSKSSIPVINLSVVYDQSFKKYELKKK